MAHDEIESGPLHLLKPGTFGILSGRCCDPAFEAKDQELAARVAAVRGVDAGEVKTVSITDAQKAMMRNGDDLTVEERKLAMKIFGMFRQHGLDLFPALVVDGEIRAHGEISDDVVRSVFS